MTASTEPCRTSEAGQSGRLETGARGLPVAPSAWIGTMPSAQGKGMERSMDKSIDNPADASHGHVSTLRYKHRQLGWATKSNVSLYQDLQQSEVERALRPDCLCCLCLWLIADCRALGSAEIRQPFLALPWARRGLRRVGAPARLGWLRSRSCRTSPERRGAEGLSGSHLNPSPNIPSYDAAARSWAASTSR